MLTFHCPSCNSRQEIEAIFENASCVRTVILPAKDGDPIYGPVDITDGGIERFQCRHCGHEIPVEPDEDSLKEWLAQQPNNLQGAGAQGLVERRRNKIHNHSILFSRLCELQREQEEIMELLKRNGYDYSCNE